MEAGKFQFETMLGAGGFELHLPFGVVVSANITPDRETGIGGWTDDEIERAIARGVGRDGSALMPPMAYGYYANITDADLDAIVAYLRSMAPIRSKRAARLLPARR